MERTSCWRATSTAEAEGLGVSDRQAVQPPKGTDRARPAARHHHARHAPARNRVQTGIADQHHARQEAETSSQAGVTPRADDKPYHPWPATSALAHRASIVS